MSAQTNTWGGSYSARQNAKNAYDVVRKELFREYEQMDSFIVAVSWFVFG